MNEDLQRMGKVARNVVVRLVSNKSYSYHVMGEMKERYGDGYPDSFPYQSKLLLAFQTIEHRDVLCFGMYVQEYGSHCPQPNTNRTYISYLDSVPYMETQPEGERTAVYHGIINGYLKHACAMGFEYAHIWVAPPQSGDEYIFHCRPMHPKHGHKAMSMQKLRSWYEALLLKAKTVRSPPPRARSSSLDFSCTPSKSSRERLLVLSLAHRLSLACTSLSLCLRSPSTHHPYLARSLPPPSLASTRLG